MRRTITLLFSVCLFCFTTEAQILDDTFGNSGVVINNISSSRDIIEGIAIQDDGKILTTGASGNRYTLVRYNSDGTFDTSFGDNGLVRTNLIYEGYVGIPHIFVQSDNKIVVSGSNNYKPFVARFNTDGTLDNTFGNNGVQQIVIESIDNSSMPGMTLTEDDKILVFGNKGGNVNNPSYLFIKKLNTDGSADTSFGLNQTGIAQFSRNIDFSNGLTALNTQPRAIEVNDQGEIFIQIGFSISTEEGYVSDYGIAKFSSSGIWDKEFGESGIAPANINHTGQINHSGFKILDDGKIISIARKIYNPLPKRGFLLIKYNTDGSLDTSFGTNGVVETLVNDSQNLNLEILSSGKILLTGDNLRTFTTVLYHSNGQIDTTYGEDGIFTYKFDPGSQDYGITSIQQPDGKIIIAGSTSHQCVNTGFGLMRLNVESEILLRLSIDDKIPLEKTSLDLQLFPNPTYGKITITFPDKLPDVNVKIYDIIGKEIGSSYFKNTNQIDFDLDVKNGIYFIQVIENNDVIANFKVLKK